MQFRPNQESSDPCYGRLHKRRNNKHRNQHGPTCLLQARSVPLPRTPHAAKQQQAKPDRTAPIQQTPDQTRIQIATKGGEQAETEPGPCCDEGQPNATRTQHGGKYNLSHLGIVYSTFYFDATLSPSRVPTRQFTKNPVFCRCENRQSKCGFHIAPR